MTVETSLTEHETQRAVVVIGAGRSGTSTLTRGVQSLGVELGNRLKRGTSKNPKGFFEDEDLLSINKRLHYEFGLQGTGTSLRPIEEQEWQTRQWRSLHDEAVRVIRGRFGNAPLWGFKSGGVMRLLPFWEQVFDTLGVEVSYVIAARHPLSVARSRAKLSEVRGRQEKSDLECLIRVVPYFHLLRSHRFTAVDYDQLMSEPEQQMYRLAERLSLPITAEVEREIGVFGKEFVSPELRHHQGEDPDARARLNPLIDQVWQWLEGLSSDRITTDDPELWRDMARLRDEFLAMGPALRHIDYLERRLASPVSKLRWFGRGRRPNRGAA
ncbi:sulfotransferase family protein [Kushneria phosphatilytica]|uniref:Uncharacterized protein n=1 Tax=Kushneria phosphatilytica TaxID=657387 RepID=A0A1S1NS69_9GAMM|nr:hypothetical protein [Kushneria phosphatilytica]OHV07738.1 hypothetical protein BH688_16280 [Kushneria phosphatilytica]QEL10241.1 hypothetical protein FY550_03205 [Kushneria phosphatilytica]